MGASSVTGVGVGSAEKNNKNGPGNARGSWVPKLSPHILWAGSVALDAGSIEVSVPASAQIPADDLAILITVNSTNLTAVTDKNETDDVVTTFDISGTGSDIVDFILVNKGLA